MRWWCSAQATAWTWTWRPYVGVWILVLLLVAGRVALGRRVDRADETPGARRARDAAFGAGAFALWAALDWPIGALAAGYLASLHMVQFLLVALVAPPLLLLSVPPAAWRRLADRPAALRFLEPLTRPLVALVLFVLVVTVTHVPAVVDTLMASQAGSFLIDMAWLLGGLVFWWPVASPVPARPSFGYPVRMAYLIGATILSTAPFVYLTFSDLPVYATYELAPPVGWISALEDQQLAGILMKSGGGLVLWTALAALFFRWWASEGRE